MNIHAEFKQKTYSMFNKFISTDKPKLNIIDFINSNNWVWFLQLDLEKSVLIFSDHFVEGLDPVIG